jgi:hypothetical protein
LEDSPSSILYSSTISSDWLEPYFYIHLYIHWYRFRYCW